MKLTDIKPNPNNPRIIKDANFKKLVKSIEEFPKMMALRPIVVDEAGMVLGGNMRLKALQHLKFKEIPDEWVKRAADLTEDEQRRFIIADNVSGGEWDVDDLSKNWDLDILESWGLLLPEVDEQIDSAEDGDEIEVPQSVQIEPPKEYIMILAEPNSEEWEELKQMFKLKMVRRGGYKKGSTFDSVGLERVILFDDFKNRLNADSDTK